MNEESNATIQDNVAKAHAEAEKSLEKTFGTNRKLASYGQFNELDNVKKIDDLVDQPVKVTGYFLAEGQQGPYAFIQCVTLDGEEVNFMCGGSFVLSALKNVKDANEFPVIATFYKKGRAILVK